MFESVYSSSVTPAQFFLMMLAALLSGVIYSWLMSFRVQASRRFFIVTSVIPFTVGTVLTFVSGNIGAGVAFGGVFALTRFRSAQGSADEIAALLIAMGAGVAFGLGYLAYGALILLCLGAVFLLLSSTALFDHSSAGEYRLLNITIPESLNYVGAFDGTFGRYLDCAESVGVKTTGMGSMFRLSFRIRMKNRLEEKAFIDELRTLNGNLEIAVLPFPAQEVSL